MLAVSRFVREDSTEMQVSAFERLLPMQFQVQLPSAWLEAEGYGIANHLAGFRPPDGEVKFRVTAFSAQRLRQGNSERATAPGWPAGMERKRARGNVRNAIQETVARASVHSAGLRIEPHLPRAKPGIGFYARKRRSRREVPEGSVRHGAEQGPRFLRPADPEPDRGIGNCHTSARSDVSAMAACLSMPSVVSAVADKEAVIGKVRTRL